MYFSSVRALIDKKYLLIYILQTEESTQTSIYLIVKHESWPIIPGALHVSIRHSAMDKSGNVTSGKKSPRNQVKSLLVHNCLLVKVNSHESVQKYLVMYIDVQKKCKRKIIRLPVELMYLVLCVCIDGYFTICLPLISSFFFSYFNHNHFFIISL